MTESGHAEPAPSLGRLWLWWALTPIAGLVASAAVTWLTYAPSGGAQSTDATFWLLLVWQLTVGAGTGVPQAWLLHRAGRRLGNRALAGRVAALWILTTAAGSALIAVPAWYVIPPLSELVVDGTARALGVDLATRPDTQPAQLQRQRLALAAGTGAGNALVRFASVALPALAQWPLLRAAGVRAGRWPAAAAAVGAAAGAAEGALLAPTQVVASRGSGSLAPTPSDGWILQAAAAAAALVLPAIAAAGMGRVLTRLLRAAHTPTVSTVRPGA